MPTWKRVLLEGETDNLAGADLTQSDADRYHLIPSPGTLRFSNESAYNANAADAACLSIDLNSGTTPGSESQFRLGQRTDLYTNSFLLGGEGSGGDQVLGVKNSAAYGNHGYFEGSRFVFDCTNNSDSVRIVDSGDNGSTEDPVLVIYRDSSSPATNDNLGAIKFNGNLSSALGGDERTYARIISRIPKTGGTGGELHFEVMQAQENLSTNPLDTDSALSICSEPDETDGMTSNEIKLAQVKARGATMKQLTQRFLTTYQFGYIPAITSNNLTNPVFQDMRGINAVPHDGNVGIPIHHDGWITGVSLSCKKSGGSSSTADLGVYIYRNGVTDGTQTVWGSEQIMTGVTFGEGMLYHEEDLNNHSSGTSGHQVFKGDFLRVKAHLKSRTGTSFSANSFGGCISIYHEL